MNEPVASYFDLECENTWIEYLRTRLPYSFKPTPPVRRNRRRHFALQEPERHTEALGSEHHNFWKRGNVCYMMGKLLDCQSMSDIWRAYRMQIIVRELRGSDRVEDLMHLNPHLYYNSMQLEKVWGFALDNHLDRERVLMANIMLSLELCLKAIMTHANFRESGQFKFDAGHDIVRLYEDLPESLRDEISTESTSFAKDYMGFRREVEDDVKKLQAMKRERMADHNVGQQEIADWDGHLATRIRTSSYTAFVNSNDPGAVIDESWFQQALDATRELHGFCDISQYYRYAPARDSDELPIEQIHSGLLLGRFFYEHLFPGEPDVEERIQTPLQRP